jgi:alpha-L-fucosidase
MIEKPHLVCFLSVALLALTAVTGFSQKQETLFEPTWESLEKHEVPEWYHDAKLGIFVHWGLYSVPAWATPTGKLGEVEWNRWFRENPYAEWYLNSLRIEGSPTWRHHRETYGEEFDYLDFIPIFKEQSKQWKPLEWMKLFKEIGARYVVLTAKHADGFTLWPSRVRNPEREPSAQGMDRDLVRMFVQAARQTGLRPGLYYCGGMDWSFEREPVQKIADVWGMVPESEEYATLADAHWRELMDWYDPDILWNDISYPQKGDLKGIVLRHYSRKPEGLVNNRWGTGFGDFKTPEYSHSDRLVPEKWETCRGFGYSFGYNQNEGPEHTLTLEELIGLFVDIVSKNGNLLLNVGPRADGSIPDIQHTLLRGFGDWLAVHGEALFGTRPCLRAEGKTASGVPIRFTQKEGAAFAIFLNLPTERSILVEDFHLEPGTSIRLVGGSGNDLPWSQENSGVRIDLPPEVSERSLRFFALKMDPAPQKLVLNGSTSGTQSGR